jgi:hypothetical protein
VSSKNASIVLTLSGAGMTRSTILVATPSVPSEPDHGAVRQDDLEADDVVGGEAVLEAVRAAGVLGHVAPDGAHDLTGRVRRVEVGGGHGAGHADVGDAGLHDDTPVVEIHRQDAAQAAEHDQHALGDG